MTQLFFFWLVQLVIRGQIQFLLHIFPVFLSYFHMQISAHHSLFLTIFSYWKLCIKFFKRILVLMNSLSLLCSRFGLLAFRYFYFCQHTPHELTAYLPSYTGHPPLPPAAAHHPPPTAYSSTSA